MAGGAAFVIFAGGPESACRSATQITFLITTDEPCGSVKGTAISVGTLGAALDAKPPSTTSTFCDDTTHSLGSLVVVPSGDRDAELAVRIVTGTSSTTDQCIQNNFTGGCIVARRAIHFIPHSPITVPVNMQSACVDQVCSPDQTCNQGVCAKVVVDCTDATCNGGGEGGPTSSGGWHAIKQSILSARTANVAVAIGRKVFIWGGYANGVYMNDGAIYDAQADTWRMIPNGPLSPRGGSAYGVSKDGQVVIYGGDLNGSDDTDGAVYKYQNGQDVWTKITAIAGLGARTGQGSVYTPLTDELVVYGGNAADVTDPYSDAAAFHVATATWRSVPASPLAARTLPSMVTTQDGNIVVFGGLCTDQPVTAPAYPCTDFSIYNPQANTWSTPKQFVDSFVSRVSTVSVNIGDQALFWGGVSGPNGGAASADGLVIDPSGNLTPIAAPDPSVLSSPARWDAMAWTTSDEKMWVWGGTTADTIDVTNSGASYDPASKIWTAMPSADAPSARTGSVAVWTGTEEVIWSGWDPQAPSATAYFSDGALFTP